MCLATPSKVIKIKDNWATVQAGDHTHRVSLDLLKNIKLGDYLLIHDELAINKIPKNVLIKLTSNDLFHTTQ